MTPTSLSSNRKSESLSRFRVSVCFQNCGIELQSWRPPVAGLENNGQHPIGLDNWIRRLGLVLNGWKLTQLVHKQAYGRSGFAKPIHPWRSVGCDRCSHILADNVHIPMLLHVLHCLLLASAQEEATSKRTKSRANKWQRFNWHSGTKITQANTSNQTQAERDGSFNDYIEDKPGTEHRQSYEIFARIANFRAQETYPGFQRTSKAGAAKHEDIYRLIEQIKSKKLQQLPSKISNLIMEQHSTITSNIKTEASKPSTSQKQNLSLLTKNGQTCLNQSVSKDGSWLKRVYALPKPKETASVSSRSVSITRQMWKSEKRTRVWVPKWKAKNDCKTQVVRPCAMSFLLATKQSKSSLQLRTTCLPTKCSRWKISLLCLISIPHSNKHKPNP